MVEVRGEINVKPATMKVHAHRFLLGQFFGSSGSFGPSKVTWEKG